MQLNIFLIRINSLCGYDIQLLMETPCHLIFTVYAVNLIFHGLVATD